MRVYPISKESEKKGLPYNSRPIGYIVTWGNNFELVVSAPKLLEPIPRSTSIRIYPTSEESKRKMLVYNSRPMDYLVT